MRITQVALFNHLHALLFDRFHLSSRSTIFEKLSFSTTVPFKIHLLDLNVEEADAKAIYILKCVGPRILALLILFDDSLSKVKIEFQRIQLASSMAEV
jgi:hypothetical protein